MIRPTVWWEIIIGCHEGKKDQEEKVPSFLKALSYKFHKNLLKIKIRS